MPNSAVDQLNYPGSHEREQSADEFWSDLESDNNHSATQDELNGSRALKRKRPLTVSYVILPYLDACSNGDADASCVNRERFDVVCCVLCICKCAVGLI